MSGADELAGDLIGESAGELAAFAEEVGTSDRIAIEGGRTRWSAGGQLADGIRLVRAPSGIVEYVPEEMTVTVRAGTSVEELHHELGAKGQRSGLPDRGGTVGGALAIGENDLEVLGKGTVRSALLQVRYVSAEGRIVTGGGPTVKNVTGFDLPRLMVGSLGTLGCLAEVILRTNPIPARSQWYRAEGVDPFAAYGAVLAPSAVRYDGVVTWVLLEGHEVDVEAQATLLAGVGSFAAHEPPPHPTGHRWSLAPAELANLQGHDTGAFTALIGVGTVLAEKPQPPRSLAPGVRAIHERLKVLFDRTGRLNPGRNPGVCP